LSLTGGAELSEKRTNFNSNRNYGYSNELSTTALIDYVNRYPTYFGSSATIPDIGGNKITALNNRFTALYANGAYTFTNKYTISGSIRKDAANVLGVNTNQRGRPFWHAGLRWEVDKERFYSLKFLPSLNVRMSLGNGGNTGFNNSALTTISYNSATSNPIVNLPSARIRSLGNPELRWEKTRTLNFGLDFGFKNGIITGGIEYYKKRSVDVFALRPIDPTTGIDLLNANSASIKGDGIDVTLNAKLINTSQLNWNITGNFSSARFIVDEYLLEQNLTNRITDGSLAPVKGFTPYLITSYKWMGLDPTNGDPQGFFDGKVSKDWGMITTSTPWEDVVKHGSAVPVSYGNLVNNITYRSFTLSTNIAYKFNYYFRRPQFNYFTTRTQSGISTLSNEYNERWKGPGDEKFTNVPSFSYPFLVSRDLFYGSSAARIEKGDHIRIDDFSLSYSLRGSDLKVLPFTAINLTTNISNLNLILWKATKTAIDPENLNGNIIGKRISIAINLTF
jgi:hypothetical protein